MFIFLYFYIFILFFIIYLYYFIFIYLYYFFNIFKYSPPREDETLKIKTTCIDSQYLLCDAHGS